RLRKIERAEPPFQDAPCGREIRWTDPVLVAEVAFTEWTRDGHLRHPSFKGLREDKVPETIRREEASPPLKPDVSESRSVRPRAKRSRSGEVAGISLSNPERVLYPDEGVTKQELAEYYEAVGTLMLPHVISRPLMVLRCPKG